MPDEHGRARPESRVRVALVGIRLDRGWDERRSTDVVQVLRQEGRVRASRRSLPDARPGALPALLRAEAGHHLAGLDRALEGGGPGSLVLQAAIARAEARVPSPVTARDAHEATVREAEDPGRQRTVSLLVRAESPAGPLLFGTAAGAVGGDLAAACAEAFTATAAVFARSPAPVVPARGWRERPLLLRPAVVATIIVGARMALGSPSAVRLDRRRVLPDLTLTDEPGAELTLGRSVSPVDDLGHPAVPLRLVGRGRITIPERDATTGIIAGRAHWDHDLARLTTAPHYRLRLTGRRAEPSGGDEAGDTVELFRCVEGLRRYGADGRMRLMCLARLPERPGWFRVELSGRPLTVLRATAGIEGPAAAIHDGHQVSTPSLMLPAAAALSASGRDTNGGVIVRSL